MHITEKVKDILDWYSSESPAVKSNIAKILMTGKLAGTGKILILPVDQGFEHGPAKSFAINNNAYDPEYHVKLALDAQLNAYAAPKGMIEYVADKYCAQIPFILKMNSSNSLYSNSNQPMQAITSTIKDAIYLGCTAVGFTIYPGSDDSLYAMQEISELISEAKSHGLATVIWSYPRGGDITKEGETSLDIIAYAAHIAALLGANMIKVKPPSANIAMKSSQKIYATYNANKEDLSARVEHIMKSSFSNKRLVIFSGGATKNDQELYEEVKKIKNGGASGSIIGRNAFQRTHKDALNLLSNIIDIYLEKA